MNSAILGTVLALLSGLQEKPAAPAPREIRLSLKECVHLALNHNLDIEISRYQPWIEDQNVLSAFGVFDHIFYAEVSDGRNRQASSSSLSGAAMTDTEDGLFRTGVRRTLPSGLLYDVTYTGSRFETNSAFATLNPRWQDSIGLSLTMPLLRGRGEVATTTSIVVARNNRRISVHQFEQSLANTVYTVQEAYWLLVTALDVRRFREQSLEVAQRLLDDNRKRFERGVLARVDVTQAESGVASQVEGILLAGKDVDDAMDRLKRLVDPGLLRDDVVIVPLDAPRTFDRELDERQAVEAGLKDAFEKRPEYRQVRIQIENQNRLLEKAGNDRLPSLSANAGGSFNGTDDGFLPANGEMGELGTYGWSLSLVLEVPIENRSASGAWQKVELERRRLHLQNRSMEDQILVEVREAVRAIKTVEKRIEATRRARVLAQEQFEGEMNRLDSGLRTTFHVLDAQSRLSEAKTFEIRARVDYRLAVARYERATGTLLQKNDILPDQNLAPRQAVAR